MSNIKCDGACVKHEGDVQSVNVTGWGNFNYCNTAIAEDTNRGLTVNVNTNAHALNQDKTNEVRSDFETYIDDMIVSEVGLILALKKENDGSYVTQWVNDKWYVWVASAEATHKRLDTAR